MKHKISDIAKLDLIEIFDFIALDNKKAAQDMLLKFEKAFKKLGEKPKMGSKRPKWTSRDLRFWPVQKYLIIYQIEDNSFITIVRVLSV
ncbi:MAG: type II toxin-antitoxin system RelE/ParE family toxin, partial [Candidatus Omnitrophota bacterium]